MFTTKIIPNPALSSCYLLEVYWNGSKPCISIPCHNYATAEHLADRLLNGDRSEPVSDEDRTGLTTEVIAGEFYGSYHVLVFDESNRLCNAIPCGDIRTAQHYVNRPSRYIS